jgi:N-methylhydantoinase A
MHVDSRAARNAIEKKVAQPLSIPIEIAASGTIHLATVRMAQLINEMTVQVGLDPRDYALVGFGGAGPLFVASLMQETQARHAIVPSYPAVWSAFGGLFADVVHDYARSYVADFDGLNLEAVNGIAEELIALANADLARDGTTAGDAEFRFSCDVRYSGQSHELVIPVSDLPPFDREAMRRAERDFEDLHERTFAHRRPEEPRQLIALRLNVRLSRHLARPTNSIAAAPAGSSEWRSRLVWFHESSDALETRIVDRDHLGNDTVLEGPVIVEEDQSNTVVPPGLILTVSDDGDLIIRRSAS